MYSLRQAQGGALFMYSSIPPSRSYNMSRIRAKDTRPEMLVRRYLHAQGFRYRLHVKELPGKPDMVLPKYKTVIFINGCFWHGHEGCKYYVVPKANDSWLSIYAEPDTAINLEIGVEAKGDLEEGAKSEILRKILYFNQ